MALNSRFAPSRRGFIAMMGLAAGLSAFGMASIAPGLPAMATAFGRGYDDVQFVVSAYLLGLAVCQPFQGLLSDRFGRRPVLLAGFTVFLLASLAASVAPNLSVLVVCRLLQAAGVSVATVVTRAIVRDTHDAEDGAVVLAFVSMVMGVAPIVAPLVGGIVISGFDWHAVFLAHAFIAALLLAWMTRSLRETRSREVVAAPLRQFSTGVASLTQDRAFVGYTLGYACVSAATFLFVTVGAEIFTTRYGIDAATFGLLWSTLAIAYAGGSYAAARLTRRHGSQRTIRWAMRTHAISGLLVLGVSAWVAAPLVAFCLALMILMGSAGMASPLALAGAVAGRADVAGLASGVSSAIAMFFSMLAAMAAGVAFDGTALSVAWFMPPACLAGWYAVNMALRHHVDRR